LLRMQEVNANKKRMERSQRILSILTTVLQLMDKCPMTPVPVASCFIDSISESPRAFAERNTIWRDFPRNSR